MKTVSVIIPTYNRARYIEAAIDSVLGQKLPKGYGLEVVVVDDGSTDNTAQLLTKYKDTVVFIPAHHSGKPAVARNIGIRASKGDLIAFQDSDDVWAEDKLLNQVPVFEDESIVLSYGNAKTMDADGKLHSGTVVAAKELADGEKFSELLQHNVISTLTVMVRRAALDEVGLFDESDRLRAVEDYELWLRISARYPKGIRSIDATFAHYRTHDQNISAKDNVTALRRILNVLETAWGYDLSDKQREQLEAAIQTMQENWARARDEADPASRPLISVVMSVYNGEKFLRPAMEGILSQTFRQFEFIIIEDGSKDRTADILKEYNDPRIRLFPQVNHGLYYSMNKGFHVARGQFIARQDADDISLPSRFEKELQMMLSNNNLGAVGTFFSYVDEETTEPKGITITGPTLHLDVKRSMYFGNPLGHGTMLIRKSVFDTVDFYNGEYYPAEDFELWRRIADEFEVAIIPESLYIYRINSNSISHTKGEQMHHFTDVIIAEQWEKPFVYKSASHIALDGRYYKNMPSIYAPTIYGQYLSQQINIGRILLEKGWLKVGLKTAYGTWKLQHSTWRYFAKPFVRGFKKRLRGRTA